MAKKYKCSYCEKRLIRKDLITHIDKSHKELIPENYTAARLVYNQVNKVDHGKCRVCGKPTAWSEKSGRYDVLCGDPKCKEHMREEYKKNMLRVKGTYNILNNPEQQKKMLANRSISGQYKFQDGGVLTYTGSYEKKCLEFMDIVMQIPSKDILSPGPTLEYEYNGEKHFYITDFYYIPYNLIIEVKDGGDNLNTKDSASMKASREKTIEKERLITDRGEYNYIRLTNNNFAQLIEVFMIIKEKLLEGDDSKTYRINESQVVLEDYFVDKKDIYYNKDKFDSGEINLCFITGLSGSGKTAMGKTMQSGNIEVYELDDIISNWNFSDANLKEYGSLVYSFFKGSGKRYRYVTYDDWKNDPVWDNKDSYVNGYEAMLIKDFVKYAKSYANSHKNTKFILEGIWIFYFIDPKELDNYAIYIKGTSVANSYIRSAKRDAKGNNTFTKFMGFGKQVISVDRMKTWNGDEKRLTQFRDYFSFKVINEASRSNKFIRITYDGWGIYQAFKENVPFGVWKSFKNSNAANWLPLPPSYEGNYRSYFTTTGYKMFMKRTYPVMIKYLDKGKIKIEEVYLQQSNIIYEDKFQVVISEDNTINESLEDVSGIIFGKRKLFQDEYITLYHGTDLGNLKEIIPNS